MPLQLIVKCATAYTQHNGGFLLVAAGGGQGHPNELFFNVIHAHPHMERRIGPKLNSTRLTAFTNPRWKQIRGKFLCLSQQDGALDDVSQLANVARPRIKPEQSVRFSRNQADGLLILARVPRDKIIGKK